MGLLRLLLKLFAPRRQRYRYRRSSRSYQPVPAPVPKPPREPLRQVEEPLGQQILRGRCWVVDGDTIVIDRVNIRLAGIDAPELDHPFGQQAKRALIALCRGQVVTAITDGSSSYERVVATCTLEDGRDLSAEMVKCGLALDWGKFSGGKYRHLEAEGLRKKLWRVEAKHRGRMPPPDTARKWGGNAER
ncbi:thermonuclease family protein [Gemmobacter sp. LW-1]|uniref:thermonuclease family protein n=1 Tax=Gemmobacter sp. LW-1 TaxID=1529005 RepID=UPI0009E6F7DD|nr:thermonuclease family protein [Gemmobacter sp. LW-1]